jgi:hypothetical protein
VTHINKNIEKKIFFQHIHSAFQLNIKATVTFLLRHLLNTARTRSWSSSWLQERIWLSSFSNIVASGEVILRRVLLDIIDDSNWPVYVFDDNRKEGRNVMQKHSQHISNNETGHTIHIYIYIIYVILRFT